MTSGEIAQRLIRVTHARFDVHCSEAMRQLLDESAREVDISARVWGLLTGMVVSYARPFTKSYAYGRLEAKWGRFEGRPDLTRHHKRLLHQRNTLLAHNDTTQHRRVLFFTTDAVVDDKPAALEGRSPINLPGVGELRDLFVSQDARLAEEAERLAADLEDSEGWPAGHEFELDVRPTAELQVKRMRPHRTQR